MSWEDILKEESPLQKPLNEVLRLLQSTTIYVTADAKQQKQDLVNAITKYLEWEQTTGVPQLPDQQNQQPERTRLGADRPPRTRLGD
jgi:hypothetical protein